MDAPPTAGDDTLIEEETARFGNRRLVAGRFLLERLASEGGAGTVYEARDVTTGAKVAVKLLRHPLGEQAPVADRARFEREVAWLERTQHPNIVGYVAHGATPETGSFLAMSWVEGPTLAERTSEAPLDANETLALGAALASALAALHAQGVVHRDLKPSNIILAGGEPARATLLDFGLARPEGGASPLTQTGVVLGTPGFMAPEQIRGAAVDARTDLFALGCVLYFAVSARYPFGGGDLVSILARTAFEPPPPLAAREASARLRELIDALVEKPAQRRPQSAAAVAEMLAGMQIDAAPTSLEPRSTSGWLSPRERRIAALVIARAARSLQPSEADAALVALDEVARQHDAHLEYLPDGSAIFALSGGGAATDLATRAARAATDVLRALASFGAEVAMVTGPASADDPLGELIARSAKVLRGGARPRVAVDEVTAKLVEADFVIAERDGGFVLVTERSVDAPTALLGRQTPCVGRDRELAMIEALYQECAEESVARSVLVKARAGQGKTRLRREVVHRLRDAEVWIGRPSTSRSGAVLGLLLDLLARVFEIGPHLSNEGKRARLAAGVSTFVDAANAPRVSAFLGEAMGSTGESLSREVLAARRNPGLMSDNIRQAWLDLLRAALAKGPLVLVLEDLHQADAVSLELVSAALKELADQPLFVLATARPEIDEKFPDLWIDRDRTELRLPPLTPRAATRLVREVLGADATDEVVKRIVDLSEGNPFYLEELVRSAHDGRGDELPETVVAMAQARLDELDDEARHLLRAASIFDASFPVRGVAELVGKNTNEVRRRLESLVERELLAQRRDPTAAGDSYGFRHELLREAAYASLTERDRKLGHRLAARFLEAQPGALAVSLAFHFDQGGDQDAAAKYYGRAAESALEASDFGAAATYARAALARGATERGHASLILAKAMRFLNDRAAAMEASTEAARELAVGSPAWYEAESETVLSAAALARQDLVGEAVLRLLAREGDALSAERVTALARGVTNTASKGDAALATRMLLAFQAEAELSLREGSPLSEVERLSVEAFQYDQLASAALRKGRMYEGLQAALGEARCLAMLGDARTLTYAEIFVGWLRLFLGQVEVGMAELERIYESSKRRGLHNFVVQARMTMAEGEARLGSFDQALAIVDEARRGAARGHHTYLVLLCNLKTARFAVTARRWELAERALAAGLPEGSAVALTSAVTAEILLARGDVPGALAAGYAAVDAMERMGVEGSPSVCQLALVRALSADHRTDEANALTRRAAQDLLERASAIPDEALRRSYLERVQENADLLALAREGGAS